MLPREIRDSVESVPQGIRESAPGQKMAKTPLWAKNDLIPQNP
jgi:hypothetical protein